MAKTSVLPGWIAAGAAVVMAAIAAITAREDIGVFLFEEIGEPQARVLVWLARMILFTFGFACGWTVLWLTVWTHAKKAREENAPDTELDDAGGKS